MFVIAVLRDTPTSVLCAGRCSDRNASAYFVAMCRSVKKATTMTNYLLI